MSRGGGGKAPFRELAKVERQVAALAWLPDPLRFMLVTSRRRRRWILPKGGIGKDLGAPASAAREAWEEAGVIGQAEAAPIGRYHSRKVRPPRSWQLEIDVYPLAVTEIRDDWPEAGERSRRLVTLDEAREMVRDAEMMLVLERFAARR